MRRIIIATRGSKLALWQAEHVKSRLEGCYPGLEVGLLILKTRGDIILDVPLSKVGGKGLFVKEIEEALLDGRADLAVHSMKDVPMQLPRGLLLGIVPEREKAEDLFLSVHYDGLEELPSGALVGTSSLRRQAQLLALRPDLQVTSLRGNVDTRLRKLEQEEFDAVIMALAGLKRLNLKAPRERVLSMRTFLPASGQGAMGLEYLESRRDLAELLAFMEHAPSRARVEAERAFLAALGGGCQTPIAAHAVVTGSGSLLLDGLVASLDGSRIIRQSLEGSPENAAVLGRELAETVKSSGGGEILSAIYAGSDPHC